MNVKMSDGKVHSVYLEDDGTMDTVISVDGKDFRFDCEYAAEYRLESGEMTERGIKELGTEAWEEDY